MTPPNPPGRLLLLDTSRRGGVVGIADDGESLLCRELDESIPTAQTLFVAVQDLVSRPGAPAGIAVAVGPGSFTGIRIAVTAAKSLAYAWKIPVLAIDSLAVNERAIRSAGEVAADQPSADESSTRGFLAVRAYRGQAYVRAVGAPEVVRAASDPSGDEPSRDSLQRRFAENDLSRPEDASDEAVFAAAGTFILSKEALAEVVCNLPVTASIWTDIPGKPFVRDNASRRICPLPPARMLASSMAALARHADSDRWADPIELRCRYLRPSAAEEQRAT